MHAPPWPQLLLRSLAQLTEPGQGFPVTFQMYKCLESLEVATLNSFLCVTRFRADRIFAFVVGNEASATLSAIPGSN